MSSHLDPPLDSLSGSLSNSPLGRRGFLQSGLVLSGVVGAQAALASAGQATIEPEVQSSSLAGGETKTIRLRVWDERQKEQKQVYPQFLGNWIAEFFKTRPGIQVTSVSIDDPEQGISEQNLNETDVLIWWGHVRQSEVSRATGQRIVERIKKGQLDLIALHSAHWATPFVEAMNDRTKTDAEKVLEKSAWTKKKVITYQEPPQRYTIPKMTDRVTPYISTKKFPDGTLHATVHLPWCCFPAYRGDGKPSTVKVLKPEHPIAKGIESEFTISHTEMYNEPFHVPEPDEVVLEECWAAGEWFRSGMVWNLGKGKVFYFRPGHETFPVFKEPTVLKILENAVRWLGNS